MKNVRLYCCTIKHFEVLEKLPDYIVPVGLGNNDFPNNWLVEKVGENISDLNPYYAEFTMFYWMWKNKLSEFGDNDFIGTCQHRWLWLNEFYKNVEYAFTVSKRDQLLTFGINPKFPSTNYGYIKVSNTIESFQKVLRFTEKPNKQLAEKFLKSKIYFWNSGIFVWSTEAIINAFEKLETDLIKTFKSNLKNFDSAEEIHFFQNIFPKIKGKSIDYSILEKAENTYVIRSNFEWSDLGTWHSLFETLSKKNLKNNIGIGFKEKYLNSSTGNILFSNEKKLIIMDDLKDHIVVNNNEMIIIVPRKKIKSIQNLKEILIKKFGDHLK